MVTADPRHHLKKHLLTVLVSCGEPNRHTQKTQTGLPAYVAHMHHVDKPDDLNSR